MLVVVAVSVAVADGINVGSAVNWMMLAGSSAGGGYSTAGDMLKFSNALRGKKLEIPADDGTFPAEFKGAGFAGGSEGVNAVFITNGQTGYTIIVLSNYDPPSAEKPGIQIRDWLKQVKD